MGTTREFESDYKTEHLKICMEYQSENLNQT